MSSKDVRRGIAYEGRKASEHGAKHLGGPGNPDFVRGKTIGEVKCRKTPVTKPELQDLIKNKGVNYVDSKSGFTKPAVDYRNHYHKEVTLESRGKKI